MYDKLVFRSNYLTLDNVAQQHFFRVTLLFCFHYIMSHFICSNTLQNEYYNLKRVNEAI